MRDWSSLSHIVCVMYVKKVVWLKFVMVEWVLHDVIFAQSFWPRRDFSFIILLYYYLLLFIYLQRRPVLVALLSRQDAGRGRQLRGAGVGRLHDQHRPGRDRHGPLHLPARLRPAVRQQGRRVHAETRHQIHPRLRPHTGKTAAMYLFNAFYSQWSK